MALLTHSGAIGVYCYLAEDWTSSLAFVCKNVFTQKICKNILPF